MSRNVQQRSRSYCFTLNNPTAVERDELLGHCGLLGEGDGDVLHKLRAVGYGEEVGANGTPHLQGWLYSDLKRSIPQLKNVPGLSRAHFEACKGTIEQNIAYCSKEGDYSQYGSIPSQGKRIDLEAVVELVRAGKRAQDVAVECPMQFIKFHRGIERLIGMHMPPRSEKTLVSWYWGSTGTGKSKEAFALGAAAATMYTKDPINKWWDGYEQQEVVIVDDYRRDFSTFAQLLRLFDGYPMSVEVKGGTVQFNSKHIIITSPKDPSATWEGRSAEDIGQLTRRIEHVVRFDCL